MVLVTQHAIDRYRERIADLPLHEIVAAIDTPVVNRCAEFGDCTVRLASGHGLVIKEQTVVTVTPSKHYKRRGKS